MALAKTIYKAGIKALLNTLYSNTDTAQAREDFADGMANLTEAFIKSGTVNVTVVTTGNATNHTGSGTGTIT